MVAIQFHKNVLSEPVLAEIVLAETVLAETVLAEIVLAETVLNSGTCLWPVKRVFKYIIIGIPLIFRVKVVRIAVLLLHQTLLVGISQPQTWQTISHTNEIVCSRVNTGK